MGSDVSLFGGEYKERRGGEREYVSEIKRGDERDVSAVFGAGEKTYFQLCARTFDK